MKKVFNFNFFNFSMFLLITAFTSCSPQVELTSSWSNKKAEVKSSPNIMVMVMGSNLQNRQYVEGYIRNELIKNGYKAVSSLDIFEPTVQKYDSATMVSMLRENKIDMLITNMVVDVKEKEVYVPGTTEQIPVGTIATPFNPYYNQSNYYNNYNNYYGDYNNYRYQTVYETRETPGYTYTDVVVLIESKFIIGRFEIGKFVFHHFAPGSIAHSFFDVSLYFKFDFATLYKLSISH